MHNTKTRSSNGDIKELRKLEQKAKQQRLSIEECCKIFAYRYSLNLLQDELYWNDLV